MDIPADKIDDVLSISESFSYYKVGKELTAGCHFYGASVVSAFCAKAVAKGDLSVDTAKTAYNELIKKSAEQMKSGKYNDVDVDKKLEFYIFDA